MEPDELEQLEDFESQLLRDSSRFPSFSSSSQNRNLQSCSAPDDGMPDCVLIMSSESSQYSDSIEHLERCLDEQRSLRRVLEKALGCNFLTSIASNGTPIPKPAADLIEEIAALELEVMRLEQHLLSLYRTAFDHQLSSLASSIMIQDSSSLMQDSGHLVMEQAKFSADSYQPSIYNNSFHGVTSQSYSLENIEKQGNCTRANSEIHEHQMSPKPKRTSYLPRLYHKRGNQNAAFGPRILADYLGASVADLLPETPNRLSEEIIRCISCIYCKLADPPLTQTAVSSASPTSSLSSSSTFSPHDNWSLQCNNDESLMNPFGLESLKDKDGPYLGMLEITKISLDDDTFKYASTMLQNFRSLVQRLEKTDPLKMKHEERLAFWINIYNALVMHAHLAYGIPQNMKISSFIQKAAYNIGGHSINAYVIESSILGCCSRHPSPWLRAFFSPVVKSRTDNEKHVYALNHPEPLVHFALCSGAYSDPVVRVYTPKNIFQELELARQECIQAGVFIQKEKKIVLPRVLHYYAKDASLDLWGILEIVNDSLLEESKKKCVERCLKEGVIKSVKWSPYNAVFRFILHRELLKW